jgi:parallel beta-helix repeat protein/predicted outer membrane repeat protein
MNGKITAKNLLVIALSLLAAAQVATGKIIYVDADALGANNGTSWENAYNYLQDALADANTSAGPVEIRVAQGTYKPDRGAGITPGDRTAAFQLINGLVMRGGYAGYRAPRPNVRDIEKYETILSGDLDGNDIDVNDPCDLLNEPTRAENSYHVVTASYCESSTILDGFTITAGNANGQYPDWSQAYGGGLNGGAPTVSHCKIIANSAYEGAGGIHFDGCYTEEWYDRGGRVLDSTISGNSGVWAGGVCNPIIMVNCTISGNWGFGGAGVCMNTAQNGFITNCTFINNTAYYVGGGLNLTSCSPTVTGCLFMGNSATSNGGGIHINGCDTCQVNRAEFYRCKIVGNIAKFGGGGGLYSTGASLARFVNCIITGNQAHGYGGGVYDHHVWGTTLENCTLSGNTAYWTGGMFSYQGGPSLINCVLWGNNAVTGTSMDAQIKITKEWEWEEMKEAHVEYCCIQGWTGNLPEDPNFGPGNIGVDPCFAEPGYWVSNDEWMDGDYHLKSQAGRWNPDIHSWEQDDVTSLCIDAGDPNSSIGLESFPNGGRVNMGAYGGTEEASKSYFGERPCKKIIAGDINGDCKVDFKDFAIMASHWLEDGSEPPPPDD